MKLLVTLIFSIIIFISYLIFEYRKSIGKHYAIASAYTLVPRRLVRSDIGRHIRNSVRRDYLYRIFIIFSRKYFINIRLHIHILHVFVIYPLMQSWKIPGYFISTVLLSINFKIHTCHSLDHDELNDTRHDKTRHAVLAVLADRQKKWTSIYNMYIRLKILRQSGKYYVTNKEQNVFCFINLNFKLQVAVLTKS